VIRQILKLPLNITVACSGGVDSMAALDFLRNGRKNIRVAHFYHGTDHGKDAREIVTEYCDRYNIPIVHGEISRDRDREESPEEYWRNERMKFFRSLEHPVVTCHHLDDAVEWWIFTSLHGQPRLIPTINDPVIRPFITTEKSSFLRWADKRDVQHVDDPSNKNVRFARNRIRHNIVNEALEINPGLRKVIRKKIEKEYFERKEGEVKCVNSAA